jgi:GTPase Era involved in 16S rRNA processing
MNSTGRELLAGEKQRLIAFCEAFKNMDEQEEAEQLGELFLKTANEEYAVAFCGHFSAGKSSLINLLSNTGILPASPIPTSANIVKMKKGTPKAVVHLKNKEVVTFSFPYEIEEIKELCKDNTLVSAIEIFYESDNSEANISFYDTPGIDSTDPAHKEATENVVYLADLIFYVMDYNHILSETNIDFIKDLKGKGKSVRLIVNQIDKHRDEELSFTEFKSKVFDAFKPYGVKNEHIFFTSTREPSFKHNDLPALTAYLKKIEMNKERLLVESTNRQLQHFVTEYMNKREIEIVDLESINNRLVEMNRDKSLLETKTKEINERVVKREESIKNGFLKIIDSAQLMPFETREKAALFIDSAKSGFKVGLFFSKQKTELEKNNRKASLTIKLQESIDSQLNWHASSLISQLQKDFNGKLPEWEDITIGEEILSSFVQPGLSSEGQGLLNYCESVSGYIKKMARKQVSHILASSESLLNAEKDGFAQEVFNKEKSYEQTADHLEIEREKSLVWNEQKKILLDIVSSEPERQFSVEEYQKKYRSRYKQISLVEFKDRLKRNSTEKQFHSDNYPAASFNENLVMRGSIDQEARRLNDTASIVKHLTDLNHLSEEMNDLSERLQNRSFTMVLFGAFSAGKSSFANALFGKRILPTSPNPTTATINEIRKPDQEHAHGTVLVEMKTEEEIIAEINAIKPSGDDTLEVIIKKAAEEIDSMTEESQVKHLESYIHGYSWARNYIHKTITADLTEIEKYAAMESNACFVKKITVFYSCPLTDKGLVLVDTPGANSIHSRHTEVAFEYMKHADVILYVTYFNHAFSHADREFLIQLGRIKDTFSSDKMFFAINAADLAESEDDKKVVLDHVKSNLQAFGIRNPRLFPVSSMNELVESKSSTSGFSQFSEALYQYVENDLEDAMIQSSKALLNHTKKLINNLISETTTRLEEEEEYLKKVTFREQSLLKECSMKITLPVKDMNVELKELLFYIKQRVMIRYHDFFKETIHPSAVQSKSDLVEAMYILISKLEHDLDQEYRACSLRMDKWIQNCKTEKETSFLKAAAKAQVELQTSGDMDEVYETPVMPNKLESPVEHLQKKWSSLYKSPKQFFEQGGAIELKNDFEKIVDAKIEQWLASATCVLEDNYLRVIQDVENRSKDNFDRQIAHYFSSLRKPGDIKGRLGKLQHCLDEIEKVID